MSTKLFKVRVRERLEYPPVYVAFTEEEFARWNEEEHEGPQQRWYKPEDLASAIGIELAEVDEPEQVEDDGTRVDELDPLKPPAMSELWGPAGKRVDLTEVLARAAAEAKAAAAAPYQHHDAPPPQVLPGQLSMGA